MTTPFGIQGQLLEITVVGCNKLRDTEWISRQDPYVCLEYASTKFRTRTCTDGGKNPTFNEKFVFNLIEGLREINVLVWNSNTLSMDDFIGSGKIQLQKVLTQGYDDSPWTLQSKSGRYSGEVRVIMHYASAQKPGKTYGATAPPYPAVAPPQPYVPPYTPPASYPPAGYPTPPPYSSYPSYPQASAPYVPPTYPPPTTYPPQTYPPSPYPQQPYPPPPSQYCYPPAPYPGTYPPPPY